MGRPLPLSRRTESSLLTATTSRSPSCSGLFQVGNVARMDNVKTTVGEHHPLTLAAGVRHGDLQLLQAHYAAAGALVLLDRPAQLRRADHRGTQLAHHDTGGDVGQGRRPGQARPGRKHRCEHGDNRIPGTGHIKHFPGPGRQVEFLLSRAQQGHAVFAASYQQRIEVEVRHQLPAPGNKLRLRGAGAHHCLQLLQVGGQQRRPAVAAEIAALGIDQHWNSPFAGNLDQRPGIGQGALGIVRQHQHIAALQQSVQITRQGSAGGSGRLLEVQPQQLLMAADHPQLGGGGASGQTGENAVHAGTGEHILEGAGHFVVARVAREPHLAAQGGHVECDVPRAAGAVGDVLDPDHRYRRLRGDARGGTRPVTVQHDISQHEHASGIEAGHVMFHGCCFPVAGLPFRTCRRAHSITWRTRSTARRRACQHRANRLICPPPPPHREPRPMIPDLPIDIDLIKGFLAPDEADALYQYALQASTAGPVLEIGSYCGKSTVCLGLACQRNGSTLFALDHHRGSEEHQIGEMFHDPELFDSQAETMDSFREFRRNIRAAGLEEVVVPIVAGSAAAARHWHTPLGMVFIDGGHSLEAALADYRCWAVHVLRGGILAIHDLFADAHEGGQAPYAIYRLALASGLFESLGQVNSLGLLRRL